MNKLNLRLEYMKLYGKKNKSPSDLARFAELKVLLG